MKLMKAKSMAKKINGVISGEMAAIIGAKAKISVMAAGVANESAANNGSIMASSQWHQWSKWHNGNNERKRKSA
jgi:hypothetical protein